MDKLAGFFKLLSDETRLRLVMLLNDQPLCVCQMSGILKLSQPKVSKHLAKLRDVGLVRDVRREQFIYYSINRESAFYNHIFDWIGENKEQFATLQEDLKRLGSKDSYLNTCGLPTGDEVEETEAVKHV